jgi:hypothetical protein
MSRRRSSTIPLAALVLGTMAAAGPAAVRADTIVSFDLNGSSDLAGSPTGSPTAFCVVGNACPSDPAFALGANVPISGSVSFDLTTQTMTFSLTLDQSATFGSLTLPAGSTLSASGAAPVSVSVSSSTKKGVTTDTILSGSATSIVSTNLVLPTGFSQTANQPIISGIDCLVTASAGGSCGFVLGTPVSGPSALQISNGSGSYDGVFSVSATLVPVPLPAALPLLISALGLLAATAGRRFTPDAFAS